MDRLVWLLSIYVKFFHNCGIHSDDCIHFDAVPILIETNDL